MVVSGGSQICPISISSKPTTDRSPGTRKPCAFASMIAPMAISSLAAKTAVGRGEAASKRAVASRPARIENAPGWTASGQRSSSCASTAFS